MRPFTVIMAFAVLAGLTICSPAAYADEGLTSTGDTLPVGAGGQNVLTITGSTQTVQFDGPVIVGNTTAACGAGNVGSVRYNSGVFQGCNGTAWGPLGADASFNVTSNFTPQANVVYPNYTGGPLFLSSNCPNSPNSSGYVESIDYYIYGPNGPVDVGHGRIAEGGSDVNFSAAPFASAIVPTGYFWSTTMACTTTATGLTAYEVASCGSANGAQMTTAPTTAAQLCQNGTATDFTDTFSATLEQCTRGGGRSGDSTTFETTLYAGNFTWNCVDTHSTASCGTVTPTNTSVMPGECKPYTAPVKSSGSSGNHGR